LDSDTNGNSHSNRRYPVKFTGDTSQHFPPQIEQFQSILMLLLAISGTYLFLITYIAKWQRSRRKKAQETANRETGKQQKVLQ
jgi:hypothetical protein